MSASTIASSDLIDAIAQSKVVVIHEDDVGMCHGANTAFLELSKAGFLTCGSVMVPCPWFSEAAALAVEHADLDLGVHLTLTSEKRFYRWRPVTGAGRASGLIDETGHMWRTVAELGRHVVPEAAEEELRAQIDTAIAAGIDVTHLDTHMGAMMLPRLQDVYLRLATDYRLPILLPRSLDSYDILHTLGPREAAAYHAKANAAEAAGQVLFDCVLETPWTATGEPMDTYADLFARSPRGLTFVALHCNAPGELEAIEPDSAAVRVGEYDLFGDPRFADRLAAMGIRRVGFRAIRDLHRSRLGPVN